MSAEIRTKLYGSFVPLVTPIRDGAVDHEAFAELVELQVAQGTDGVVVTGTSGEPSTLTVNERVDLVRTAVRASAGRVPVVAATGSQSLAETLEITGGAQLAGADALLVVTPYYVRPSVRGLVSYFAEVGAACDRPWLVYHIPGRAAVSLPPTGVEEIRERSELLVGSKHAAIDIGYVSEILTRLGRDFAVFCGIEELSFPMLAVGAAGLMNAVGNVAPAAVAALCRAVREGRFDTARELHFELFELSRAIFWDTNPVPIKYLMWRAGLLPTDEHRLPLLPPDEELAARLDDLAARTPALARPAGGPS